jgi:L-iditol 2-dehydrogenase
MLELQVKKPMELELREVEALRAPEKDDLRIKSIYGGICGSDIGVLKGRLAHATYPLRPGHELIGTVIEAGDDAKYDVGTRIVVLPNTFCGECDRCLKGRTNICRYKKSLGVNVNGGFSEEFIISSRFVMPVPEGLPDERAVLIEPLAVVVSAFKKVTITKGTTVAIVGSGNEGMLAASLAYYLGADVTAIDINPKKLELIRRIGNIRTVSPNELRDETFDVVIEAAGVKSSVEQGVQLVSPGGEMVLIGLAPEASIPIVQLVRNEISLHGSIIYKFPDDYTQTIEYLSDSRFDTNPIVSKVFLFTDYERAYESALSGNFGKILLRFNNEL